MAGHSVPTAAVCSGLQLCGQRLNRTLLQQVQSAQEVARRGWDPAKPSPEAGQGLVVQMHTTDDCSMSLDRNQGPRVEEGLTAH